MNSELKEIEKKFLKVLKSSQKSEDKKEGFFKQVLENVILEGQGCEDYLKALLNEIGSKESDVYLFLDEEMVLIGSNKSQKNLAGKAKDYFDKFDYCGKIITTGAGAQNSFHDPIIKDALGNYKNIVSLEFQKIPEDIKKSFKQVIGSK